MKYRKLVAALVWALSLPAFSYWDEAHKSFAKHTTTTATVNSTPLENYYHDHLGFDMEDRYSFDNNADDESDRRLNDKMVWSKIIKEGASDEDYPLSRPLNHFFDPVNNHSLYQTLKDRDWGTSVFMAELLSTSTTNPNWALEDNGSILKQHYSLKDSNDLL